jgi:hypothetical protein
LPGLGAVGRLVAGFLAFFVGLGWGLFGFPFGGFGWPFSSFCILLISYLRQLLLFSVHVHAWLASWSSHFLSVWGCLGLFFALVACFWAFCRLCVAFLGFWPFRGFLCAFSSLLSSLYDLIRFIMWRF